MSYRWNYNANHSNPNFILNVLLGEFTNIDSIYQLYEPTIWTAIQLLRTDPVLGQLSTVDSPWPKRSLLPFFGDILQWITGTATMKDMTEIEWQINLLIQEQTQINLLIQEQTQQQETLVHIISILNITWYTTQANRQKLHKVIIPHSLFTPLTLLTLPLPYFSGTILW